jgi:hypothetical protein
MQAARYSAADLRAGGYKKEEVAEAAAAQRGVGSSRRLFATPGDAVQVARIRAAIDAGESTGLRVPRVNTLCCWSN